MSARPAVEIDVGGTLSIDVAESGTVSSATVTIYDENGTITSVDGATATIASAVLSYTVASGIVDAVGQYRARWAYVIGTATYRRDQVFDVARAVLRPTLSATRLVSDYYGLLSQRTHPAGMTHATALTTAWAHLLAMIEAAGSNPHQVIDPRPLEATHAALAAWVLASNFTPGGSSSQDWQAWAEQRRIEAQTLLADALRHIDWYDASDDLIPSSDEQQTNRARRRLTR